MIKYRFLIILLTFSLIPSIVTSQTSTFFTILKYSNDIEINCVTPVFDKNYIVTGIIKSIDDDLLIAKIDTLGNYLWSKKIGYYDEISQKFTNDAGIRLLNNSADSSFLVLGTTLNGDNTVLLKYKTNGQILWQKRYNTGFNTPTNIYTSAVKNEFIITGSYTDISDESLKRPFLIRTEKDGTLKWNKDYRYSKWTESVGNFTSLVPSDDGAYFVAGYIKQNSSSQVTSIYLSRIDDNGNMVWDKKLDDINTSSFHVYLLKLATNSYMLAAASKENPNVLNIYNFDNTGTVSTPVPVTLPGYTFPENLINQKGTFVFATNTTTDTTGCYFARVGAINNPFQQSPIVYSKGYNYKAKYITSTPDSGFIVITENTSPDLGQKRACIIKLNKNAKCNAQPQVSLIEEAATSVTSKVENNKIAVTNNLNALVINGFKFRNSLTYQIFDLSGKTVLSGKVFKTEPVEVSICSLPRGIYIIKVTDSYHLGFAKFIK